MWFFIVRSTTRLDGTPEREVVGDGQASWLASERLAQRLLGSAPYAIIEAASPAEAVSGRPRWARALPAPRDWITGDSAHLPSVPDEIASRIVQLAEIHVAFPEWTFQWPLRYGQLPWANTTLHYHFYQLNRSVEGVSLETTTLMHGIALPMKGPSLPPLETARAALLTWLMYLAPKVRHHPRGGEESRYGILPSNGASLGVPTQWFVSQATQGAPAPAVLQGVAWSTPTQAHVLGIGTEKDEGLPGELAALAQQVLARS